MLKLCLICGIIVNERISMNNWLLMAITPIRVNLSSRCAYFFFDLLYNVGC